MSNTEQETSPSDFHQLLQELRSVVAAERAKALAEHKARMVAVLNLEGETQTAFTVHRRDPDFALALLLRAKDAFQKEILQH